MFLYDRNIIGSPSRFFGNMFGIFRKCSETIVWRSDSFWKIFGDLRKVFENLWKIVKKSPLLCFYNKQNITRLLWLIWNFSLRVNLISHSFAEQALMRYQVEDSKEKFHTYKHSCIILYTFTCILHHLRVYYRLKTWPAPSWLDSSVGKTLCWYGRGHGFKSISSLIFFQTLKVVSLIAFIIFVLVTFSAVEKTRLPSATYLSSTEISKYFPEGNQIGKSQT